MGADRGCLGMEHSGASLVGQLKLVWARGPGPTVLARAGQLEYLDSTACIIEEEGE